MTRGSEEARRRIFRRMEWVYVYAPPFLAVCVAAAGSALLAFVVPVPDTTFRGRWALAMVVVLVIPALVHFLRSRIGRGD